MFSKNSAPITLFGHTYDQQNDSELQNQLKFTLESLKGLSKAHLEKWLTNSRNLRFNREHHQALAYLMYEKGLSPDSAIDEIIGLSVEQVRVLPLFYKFGLRGNDLLKWEGIKKDSFFSKEHSAALIYLMDEMKLSKEKAIQEINQLSSFQANLLKKYYHCGLRGESLRSWRPHPNESEFGYIHHSALIALIEEAKLEPDQALNEMHLLSEIQVEALLFGAKHGLRRKHLEHWQSLNHSKDFSITDSLRLIMLIKNRHIPPEEAVQTLTL